MMYERRKPLPTAQINRYCSKMNVVGLCYLHRLTAKFEDRKKGLECVYIKKKEEKREEVDLKVFLICFLLTASSEE